MLQPPKIPLPYRLAALAAALMLGLYTLQVYVFGAKFAGAISNYARLSAQYAAVSAPRKPVAPSEPGVVPVQIISSDKKN